MTTEPAFQIRLGGERTLPALTDIPVSSIEAVNVASVPQRSPLRYPGGKTWLVPHIRAWLGSLRPAPSVLLEPFAGGAIVSLTAVAEGLVPHAMMAELDPDVAAFWRCALRHGTDLNERIRSFTPTPDSVAKIAASEPHTVVERGFRTLVLNRTRRGGILAPGAAVSRRGENGKGLMSRWYPETLVKRLRAIDEYSDRIEFHETDGLRLLETALAEHGPDTAVFADPPYTVGGKRAGERLYTHSSIDHERLFDILARTLSSFLMTYDYSPEVVALVARYGFHAVRVHMKNTHHDTLTELVITPTPMFHESP